MFPLNSTTIITYMDVIIYLFTRSNITERPTPALSLSGVIDIGRGVIVFKFNGHQSAFLNILLTFVKSTIIINSTYFISI